MSFNKVVPPELTANLGQKLQRTQLLVWMKKVQEGLLKDWLAMRKFTAQDVKDHPEHTVKVRERIRKHCLERKL
jgi:hypothetical protein